MERITLELGMRVRCVNAVGNTGLADGAEYMVRRIEPLTVRLVGMPDSYWATRFKPVFRVKARSERY